MPERDLTPEMAAARAPFVYVGIASGGLPQAVFEDIADAQSWLADTIAARHVNSYGYITAPWTPRRMTDLEIIAQMSRELDQTHARIAELEAERDNALQTTRDSQVSSEDHMQLSWERDLAREERDAALARITELGRVVEDQLTEIGDKGEAITRLRDRLREKSARIAELERQATEDVMVEGMWVKRAQLAAVCASYMVTSETNLRAANDAGARLAAADARIAELEQQAGRRRIETAEELDALGFPCVIREIPNDPFELYPQIWEMGYQTAWCRAGVEYRAYDSDPRLPVEVLVEPPEVNRG